MIEAKGLSRSFGKTKVVDNLNFTVGEGEVFGLLGPNGAGKTTTVRMLSCLISPGEGTAYIDGLDVRKESDAMRIRSIIGLLTETPGLYDTLSAYKNLDFYGKLYDVPDEKRKERIEYYLRMMELWDKRDLPVGSFSKGMKQKMAIARCLLHEPKVVFLDEPTSGLDPEAARIVRDFIMELKGEGRTIVLCTHNLDEADRLCDRIGFLKGTILSIDTPSRLRDDLYGHTVVITLREVKQPFVDMLKSMDYVSDVEQDGSSISLKVAAPEQHNPEIVRALVGAGADVQFVSESRHSLEEVYFKIMGARQ
jgi:ABC-2 type transport system ATP-binding protein